MRGRELVRLRHRRLLRVRHWLSLGELRRHHRGGLGYLVRVHHNKSLFLGLVLGLAALAAAAYATAAAEEDKDHGHDRCHTEDRTDDDPRDVLVGQIVAELVVDRE